jgi:hypothetical protein
MSNIVHGLRTFEVTEDGGEKVNFTYRGLTPEGGHREGAMGTYCASEDALEYIQLLLAYRDGHSVLGSGRECFVAEGHDGRCSICKEVDRLTGREQHSGELDSMLFALRSRNNGL